MPSIAIIGAGCSGLAAAHVLQEAGYTVTLFEKSDDVGGRATTGKRGGFIYDYGAQYIKGSSPVSDKLITERFRVDDLIDIRKPVWIFDGQGHIQEGDPVQNADPKWTYRSGLLRLPKRMAEGLDIRLNTCVERIEQVLPGEQPKVVTPAGRPKGIVSTAPGPGVGGSSLDGPPKGIAPRDQTRSIWRLFDTSGQVLQDFERVLITIPASQAVELIEESRSAMNVAPTSWSDVVCAGLSKARYNPLLSVMLGYGIRPRSRPFYALVNTDKAHAVSWLAWEHEKAVERVPRGAGLLIAQMAPGYTLDHWDRPDNEIVKDVGRLVAELIDEDLPAPVFTDVRRWNYALPAEKADGVEVNALSLPQGLAFCGDGFVGGRVHLALEDGIRAAQQIIQGPTVEK
jgi:renalase